MTDVATIQLYSTAIVLSLWAALWALGVRGQAVIGVALALLALTAWVAERERARRRRESRGA